MRITRLEPLLVFMEKKAANVEENQEILDKISNKIAAQKFYYEQIDTDLVNEKINSGELSYDEYKILKTVLEKKNYMKKIVKQLRV